MKYIVDVKAFISVTVEAEDEDTARSRADYFVESLSPTEAYIAGYNATLAEEIAAGDAAPGCIVKAGEFAVDGESDCHLEEPELDDEDGRCACGAPLDDGEGYDGKCGTCADRAENGEEDGE